LVKQLLQENLIVIHGEGGPADESALGLKTGPNSIKERKEFEAPVLHKYIDMKDLLLLDPIHETDETGWPSASSDYSSDKK
jgi:hypothetical protein